MDEDHADVNFVLDSRNRSGFEILDSRRAYASVAKSCVVLHGDMERYRQAFLFLEDAVSNQTCPVRSRIIMDLLENLKITSHFHNEVYDHEVTKPARIIVYV